jgi:hypothetical protein
MKIMTPTIFIHICLPQPSLYELMRSFDRSIYIRLIFVHTSATLDGLYS